MAKRTTKKAKARKTTARKATRKAAKRVSGPNGPAFRTVTPHITVPDAARALEWYKDVFGAKELARMPAPGGRIMHAEILVGDSRVMLADPFPGTSLKPPTELGGTTTSLHIYHKDVDKIFEHAVEHGAKVVMPVENQFWGDRYGQLEDPFGHSWSVGYPAKMTREEKERKEREAMEQFAAAPPTR